MRVSTTGSIAGTSVLVLVAAFGPAPASGARAAGADRLTLGPQQVPGLSPGHASTAASRRHLARLVGRRGARTARIGAAAYHRGRGAAALRLSLEAFVLRSPAAARRALAHWRALAGRRRSRASPAHVGDAGWVTARTVRGRTTAAVALRSGRSLAVVGLELRAGVGRRSPPRAQLRLPRRPPGCARRRRPRPGIGRSPGSRRTGPPRARPSCSCSRSPTGAFPG